MGWENFSFREIGDENEISLAALIFCSGRRKERGIKSGGAARALLRRMNALAESLRDGEGLWVREINSEEILGPSFNRSYS